jgi:hypothetical protein
MNQMVTVEQPQAQQPRLPTLVAGAPIRPIVPQDFEGAWRIASAVCRAGMAPKGLDAPEKAMVAIMHGLEVGLTPMNALQSIAVVNGRPTVWGDGAIALARGSGLLEWMEEKFEGEEGKDAFKAICTVKRKGEPKPVRGEFSIGDAKVSGLWTKRGRDGQPTPWQQYPKRMLQMRARAFALRDGFADVLKGLAIKEEVEDYHTAAQVVREEPPAPPAAQVTHQPSEPPATPVEEMVTTAAPAETVEWSEPETDEQPGEEQPPVPPQANASPVQAAGGPGPVASDQHADANTPATSDFPGDKPQASAPDGGIPEFLRRKPEQKQEEAETFDVEAALKALADALSGVEDTDQLAAVQNKHQAPLKGKVSKADWARSQTLVMETFQRISASDEAE